DHARLQVSTFSPGNTTKGVGGRGETPIQGTYGTLQIKADGSYSYPAGPEPQGLKHGLAQDRFTYTADDGHGGTAQSTLTISLLDDDQQYIAGTPGGTLNAGNGKQVLDGGLGQQTLSGGNGDDFLIGGPGDTLIGGHGHDSFVLGPNFGIETIKDFSPQDHVIQFDHSSFASVQSVFAHMSSDGHGGTLITLDAANVIDV